MSLDNAEARTRVLQLYKAWYRHIPQMLVDFDLPVDLERSRDMLREKFRSNAHIKDTRVIDMLVVKVNIFKLNIQSIDGYEYQGQHCIFYFENLISSFI